MVIGILARPTAKEYNRFSYQISNEMKEVVWHYQGTVFSIVGPKQYDSNLSQQEKEKLNDQVAFCDGVILQGGTDIYPYDHEVLDIVEKLGIPVLGICMGMQLMAEHHSGFIKPILKHTIAHLQPECEYVHFNEIKKGSKLFQILKTNCIKVNSRHREEVIKTALTISSYSTDGVIEAIENPKKEFYIGVQWHPESMFEYDKVARLLWDAFFDAVRRYHECRDNNQSTTTESCSGRESQEI